MVVLVKREKESAECSAALQSSPDQCHKFIHTCQAQNAVQVTPIHFWEQSNNQNLYNVGQPYVESF